ncbi:MAG: acyl carrier protein [Bacilli bacterium]|jgi:acyl carrier protein|nr:acyl carrier protein [Bacilli bacterium]MDD3389538.1 acyl carrier protein [Bacilli bacterium]MDD4345160.1 acyl carrier protein [Bacilli bacterium]MDD4521014.1 acyl carrier protein [Bacilli bacterium]MDY0399760.1 acyl carrier protein [Bacilli bacterium]
MNDRIKEIEATFAETLKVDHVDPNAELRDLGLDSLDLVELLIKLEEKFGVEFSNEEMPNFKTVQDVYTAIEKKLNK